MSMLIKDVLYEGPVWSFTTLGPGAGVKARYFQGRRAGGLAHPDAGRGLDQSRLGRGRGRRRSVGRRLRTVDRRSGGPVHGDVRADHDQRRRREALARRSADHQRLAQPREHGRHREGRSRRGPGLLAGDGMVRQQRLGHREIVVAEPVDPPADHPRRAAATAGAGDQSLSGQHGRKRRPDAAPATGAPAKAPSATTCTSATMPKPSPPRPPPAPASIVAGRNWKRPPSIRAASNGTRRITGGSTR